jgi:hypothetical protein
MRNPHYHEGRGRIHHILNKALRLYLFIDFLFLGRSPSCISIFRVSSEGGLSGMTKGALFIYDVFFDSRFMFPFMISTLIHDGYDGVCII